MTAPRPDTPPPTHLHPAGDADPTGMRALLSSLPDPGPMPEHLVARIQAALQEERERQDTEPAAVGAQQAATPPTLGAMEPPHPQPSLPHHVVSLDSARARRRPWLLPSAAAAGFVLVAGGALAASGGAPGLTASLGWSGPAKVSGVQASAASRSTDSLAVGPRSTTVVMSGAVWTDPTAAGRLLVDNPGPELRDLASESPAIGPIGTPMGARDCATALGINPSTPVLVDLGTYAGSPAALVVAAPSEGVRTAYVVGRNCRLGAPELQAGPFTL